MKIKEFKIEEGIIHVLDVNCDYPILNENYLNLSNEEINLFLTKHMEKILKSIPQPPHSVTKLLSLGT